ncbi:MAG: hypothetical protein GC153_11965 [Alphaproteobacteria bacterium]|nr:hypothetical protein [Alphaproteobacteria bacterium]
MALWPGFVCAPALAGAAGGVPNADIPEHFYGPWRTPEAAASEVDDGGWSAFDAAPFRPFREQKRGIRLIYTRKLAGPLSYNAALLDNGAGPARNEVVRLFLSYDLSAGDKSRE